MAFRVFKSIAAEKAACKVFTYLTVLNVAVAVVVVLLEGITATSLSAVLLCAICAVANKNAAFREAPLSLVVSWTMSTAFVLPLVQLSLLGDAYVFGLNLTRVPSDNHEYLESIPAAIAFLALCFVSISAGLTVGNRTRSDRRNQRGTLDSRMPIGALGIIVLLVTFISNQQSLSAIATGSGIRQGLVQFLFFDHAFLILAPMIYWTRITEANGQSVIQVRRQFALLLGAFLGVSVLATSKGFILVMAVLCFIIPISYFKQYRDVGVLLPSKSLVLLLVPVSVFIFVFSFFSRISKHTGQGISTIQGAIDVVMFSGGELLRLSMQAILNRLSSALEQYVMIYHDFVVGGYDRAFALQFETYLGKNFANLILPGTPFKEAYSPSSNLLDVVLFKESLDRHLSGAELLRSLNTQPYTLPGVMIIVAGLLAPLLLFVFSWGIARVYSSSSSVLSRIAILYGFTVLLYSYGFEVGVANALHVWVSCIAFVVMLRWIRSFRIWIVDRPSTDALFGRGRMTAT